MIFHRFGTNFKVLFRCYANRAANLLSGGVCDEKMDQLQQQNLEKKG